MKEIIYLDEDFINSFISQVYDGLPIQRETEAKNIIGEEGTDTDSEIASGNGKLNLAIIGGEFNYSTSEENSLTTFETDETKEIISKKIHDNALNDLEKILIERGRLKNSLEDVKFGDFLKIETTLQLNDFEEMLNLFSESTFETFAVAVKDGQKDSIDSYEQIIQENKNKNKQLARDAERELKQLNKEIENEIKGVKYVFDLFNQYVGFMKDFMPTSTFIKTNGAVIPLDKNFLRKSTNFLNFHYNNNELHNKVTILGKVTKKVSSTNVLNSQIAKATEFKHIYTAMNEVFDEFFKLFDVLNVGEYIIFPIAVFFEDDFL